MMMMSFDERIGREEEDKEIIKKDYKLQSTNQELVEIREENQKLKELLEKTMKDYKSLQSRYLNILQQEQAKRIVEFPLAHRRDDAEEAEEIELVSLRLGTTATGYKKEEQKLEQNAKTKEEDRIAEEGLSLGTTSSTEQSNYHMPSLKDDPKERWPPSKVMKGLRGGEEEESAQPPVKKARVSVRARCETPTMNDGCQWRKYGQKTAKGNPCPRAYYRCTVAPSCPVRKQVQRNAEDMSILITTYEGTHNHTLPPSATAMASTTSAAASMLISGSSTSNLMANNATTLAGLSSLDSNNPRPRIYFSNCYTNPSPYSAPSHPTITLDLTSPASQSHPPPPSQFNYFSSHSSLPLKSWNLSKPCMPMTTTAAAATTTTTITTPSQIPMTDTIAKAITSDPSFRSALAAAITSYVGVQGGGGGELQQGLGGLVPAKYLYRNLELN